MVLAVPGCQLGRRENAEACEEKPFFGGADHHNPEEASGGHCTRQNLPQTRDRRCDVLQLAIEVRSGGGTRRPAAEGAQGRKRRLKNVN